MIQNSILLQNLSSDDLKKLISDLLDEKLTGFKPQQKQATEYLTREDVSKLLKISLPTVTEYTKTGKLNGLRMGRRVLFRKEEIEQSLTAIEPLKYRRA